MKTVLKIKWDTRNRVRYSGADTLFGLNSSLEKKGLNQAVPKF